MITMRRLSTRIWFHFLGLLFVAGAGTALVLGFTHRPVLTLVAIFVVMGAGSKRLARVMSRPIERLTDASRRFGAGELGYRIPVPAWWREHQERHPDRHRHRHRKRRPVEELVMLTTAWNEMADRIERLVRSRDELLANVSHELRSPLARIRVALELLPRTPESERRFVDLEADLAELDRLIGDILTASRLETAGARKDPVDVSAMAQRIVERAAVDPITAGKETRSIIAPGLTIAGDGALLGRAMWNLVENAAKYGAAPITIFADQRTIGVSDEGPGIPADERTRVLEPFYRADRARTPGGDRGVGLGLTLVRRVAEAHGGTVTIGPAHVDDGAERGCRVAISLS
jgi:signal transduction histidine kinase